MEQIQNYETKKFYGKWSKDYFYNKEECLGYVEQIKEKRKKSKKSLLTNPKFPYFDQGEYHAGDLNDVYRYGVFPFIKSSLKSYWKRKNKQLFQPTIAFQQNFIDHFMPQSSDGIYYGSQSDEAVVNTFKYFFHKMKKGIFVLIENNTLAIFLPFSKANYHNSWYNLIPVDETDKKNLERMYNLEIALRKVDTNDETFKFREYKKTLLQFLDAEQKTKNYFFKWMKMNNVNTRDVNPNRREWYANNCFFREEEWEGDKGVNLYKSILTTLLQKRTVPDVAFFLNPRDFPIMNKNANEPYEHLYGNRNFVDEFINKYYGVQSKLFAPIISFSGKTNFSDIPGLTTDDWEFTSQQIFPELCNDRYRLDKLPDVNKNWDTKVNRAFFRGSATGCGVKTDNNIRLKATLLSKQYPDLIDSKVVSWNKKFKKFINNQLMFMIDDNEMKKELDLNSDLKVYFKNAIERSQYKYILNLDGQTSAHRLGFEFSIGSVVILPDSENYLWFQQWLEPYVHYVPVKADLSDLIDVLNWCITHDDECRNIAKNGMDFFDSKLSKLDFQLDYLQNVLGLLSNQVKLPVNLKSIKKEDTFAIILAYRNSKDNSRKQQLDQYIEYISLYLQGYNYDIYVIEQTDGQPFNLGKIKNIGFMESLKVKNYTHYIISDIDMVPDLELLHSYIDSPRDNTVVALANKGTVYERPTFDSLERLSANQNIDKYLDMYRIPFLGGAICVNAKTFMDLNGFPNDFWGWGGEDDELLLRIAEKNFIVEQPRGRMIDLEDTTKITIKDRNKEKVKENRKYEKIAMSRKGWRDNGLANLCYEVIKHRVTDISVNVGVQISDEDRKRYLSTSPKLYSIKVNIGTPNSITSLYENWSSKSLRSFENRDILEESRDLQQRMLQSITINNL